MCYSYHIWSKEVLMQAENDDDLYGGQRSSEVKWGKLCSIATGHKHNQTCQLNIPTSTDFFLGKMKLFVMIRARGTAGLRGLEHPHFFAVLMFQIREVKEM